MEIYTEEEVHSDPFMIHEQLLKIPIRVWKKGRTKLKDQNVDHILMIHHVVVTLPQHDHERTENFHY